ncbi:hypothetical protein A3Q56_04053 [Intoshia linei]|uniref:Cysteine sulfinic acid decarboxylase n=1 Tax=Intoshia linei TaxID=1819745 RepID=A0A177B461_9BILA|nr:hypothetical protein A3Q56_04053 [Intoshia linei]
MNSSSQMKDNTNEKEFINCVYNKLVKYITEPKSKRRLSKFQQPDSLKEQLNLQLDKEGQDYDTLLSICDTVIQNSVNTGHPLFLNQLFGKIDNVSLIGTWLTSALNTSQYTFEVAPVFTLIENSILKHMSLKIGYNDCDAIFCPGGSISNMYALNLARSYKYPNVKTVGMNNIPKIAIFLSEQAHYSFSKGASFLGFGLNAMYKIRCGENGIIIMDDFKLKIKKAQEDGYEPAIVIAVAGTTVTGAFDPIREMSQVCKQYNMWLHVDACHGGCALLSTKYKHLLDGIELSDSVAWNCHKILGAAFQCCAFFTCHKTLLKRTHSASATYLFQTDKCYDVSYDTGDSSIQCGRVVDGFKLWLMWKREGDLGLEKRVDYILSLAEYLTNELGKKSHFKILIPKPQYVNVCFWYIPEKLCEMDQNSEQYKDILSKVAPYVKRKMMTNGTCMVGYQPLYTHVNFFRFVISHTLASLESIDMFINLIEKYGEEFNSEINF